jgi:histidine ammonia-lyase
VSLELVEFLMAMYNKNVLPVIYEQGSLGASGDLAPLAHLALPIFGEGEVHYKGKIRPTADVYKELGWTPHNLVAKEGLAILNGTQFMSAFGSLVTNRAFRLFKWTNLIGAISLEAFDGKLEPFHPMVHALRNQNGQQVSATQILQFLEGSDNSTREKKYVQDPYSFRCMPQVHGASYDTFEYAESIFSRELNGVNDNPNLIPDDELILSGGNFHGQPLALALDFLSIAIAELASISERRTFQLLSGQRELPSFLIDEPGLHSGLMIPQYVAAGIVSQNKQLCTPASVDSISSSNGQEDHVSMGANAATKSKKVLENSETVLAIELINASQAFHFRSDYCSSDSIQKVLADFREKVPIITEDRYLHQDIENAVDFVRNYPLDEIS